MALKAEKKRIQQELKRRVQDERERLYELRPPSAQSTRSAVWQTTHFVHHRGDEYEHGRRVTFQTQDRVNEFVACVRCKTVWAHSPTTGTKTLKQHKCPGLLTVAPAIGAAASPVATTAPSPAATTASQDLQVHEQVSHARPSLEDRDRVTDALADFCAQDLVPFSTAAGQGLANVIQTVLDVAAKYNKHLLADDLITRSPADVRENVAMRARLGRAALQHKLHAHLSTGVHTACSLDMWSDDAQQTAYLSTTIHYITDCFELLDCTLHVKPLRHDASAATIAEELYDGLAAFGLDEFSKEQFAVVSNRTLAGKADGATRSTLLYEWHPSVMYDITSCLTAALIKCTHSSSAGNNHDQQYEPRGPPFYRYYAHAPALFDLLDDCRDLVAYLELANLTQRLSKPLVQANASCWRSLLQCLASVGEMRSEILSVLVDTKKTVKVARIKEDLLRELLAFLREFRRVTLAIEKCSVPTIHEVVYWRHRLLAHLSANEEEEEERAGKRDVGAVAMDSESIVALKRILKPTIENYLALDPIHIVAALLDPAQKHRARKFGVSDAQIENGCSQLKRLMRAIGSVSRADVRDASDCFLQPQVKKQRVEPRRVAASQYSDDEEEDNGDSDDTVEADGYTRSQSDAAKPAVSLNAQVEVEFEKYLSYVVSKSERQAMSELSKKTNLASKNRPPLDGGFPLLTWWKHVGSSEFPILARVARSILCIPASSSAQASVSDSEEEEVETMAAKCSRLAPSSVNDLMFLRSSCDPRV